MYRVTIRFYEELNDFLPPQRRKRDIEVTFPGRRSVKDLIESFCVPHVEVDLVLVNGASVDFSYIVADGDRISVYPVFESFDIAGLTRLRPRPLRETRFVLDVHVEYEARFAQGPRPQARQARDVERLEDRVHAYPVAVCHDVGKIHGRAVDEYQINLHVRHAERLDEILHGTPAWKGDLNVALAPLRRKEIVELFVKAYRDAIHGGKAVLKVQHDLVQGPLRHVVHAILVTPIADIAVRPHGFDDHGLGRLADRDDEEYPVSLRYGERLTESLLLYRRYHAAAEALCCRAEQDGLRRDAVIAIHLHAERGIVENNDVGRRPLALSRAVPALEIRRPRQVGEDKGVGLLIA